MHGAEEGQSKWRKTSCGASALCNAEFKGQLLPVGLYSLHFFFLPCRDGKQKVLEPTTFLDFILISSQITFLNHASVFLLFIGVHGTSY